jgi:hypothetical protein
MKTTIKKLPVEELDKMVIASGGHVKRGDALCSMELVSWLAGEPHSVLPSVPGESAGRDGDGISD